MKGIVYAILNKENIIVYVGSTQQALLCMRKGDHTKPKSEEKKQPFHFYVEENGGWVNFTFKILEEGEFNNIIQLRIRERFYYDLYKPIGNIKKPYISDEERKQNKRNDAKRFREAHPDYEKKYEKNKKEYAKKRCETTIDCYCGKTYKKQNKTNHFKTKHHKEAI